MASTSAGFAQRTYERKGSAADLFVQVWDTRVSGKPAGDVPPTQGPVVRRKLGPTTWLLVAGPPPKLDAGFTVTRPGTEDTVDVYVGVEDGVWQDKGLNPNGTLLGRPSHYRDEAGYAVPHVYDLRGMPVTINAKLRPGVDRAAVERVAAGVRLVPAPTDPAGWTTSPLP